MGTIVNTKEELKEALKNRDKEILISNDDLSKYVINFKKIKKVSKWPLRVLIAGSGIGTLGVAAAPFTGGVSLLPAGVSHAITTASGMAISTGAIVAIGVIFVFGPAVLYALWKDYDDIDGHVDATIDENGKPKANFGGKVALKRKR